MKPSLQLKFSQQLTMTPQLQQAIKLLQLSTIDLQQEIQEALESNPLLEMLEQDFSDNEQGQNEQSKGEKDTDASRLSNSDNDTDLSSSDNVDSHDALEKNDIPDDLPLDSSWEEYLGSSSAPIRMVGSNPDDDYVFQGETSDSIQDHLMWQMELTHFSDNDRSIAIAIIDSIDDSGYLTTTCEDILDSLDNEDIELDEVECVLKRIQMFDPVGAGARSVQECLLVQLKQFDENTPWIEEARALIKEHSDLLSSKDYRTLMRKTRLKEDQLREVMRLLKTLNPRPGSAISTKEPEYVIPDVNVYKKNGVWTVELNNDALPALSVNETYASLGKTSKNPNDSQFIKSHLQEAKWFIKSLESRNETLLKVSHCIVSKQREFFEKGPEKMIPMVLNDVAEMVDMHESTISRVTTQKYMHTPRGIFELKYFFSSHVATESGENCSSTAIRAFIKKMVSAEPAHKPLSDSKIAQVLAEQGIQVARRTIAKYRESLNIPPSNQRKSLL
ncbi:RNA polymerase factor sigma-54 [Glaciecola sp. XM2]|jgi:RNA polymerase sigma-54 factor|uniref:RNA polymerase factor sigma-54 n=1 Tax=Glaciecola sp. XM2 TaxID=1914931 RepID=UPI001BDE8759|nr:RNA polymerase factor sigma-54 [Glaciecola sp. XM2]MBT1452486.1 RNA polymerase factor sigma-54 [Glaciecola sp. XM2]